MCIGDKVIVTEGAFKDIKGYVAKIESDLQIITSINSADILGVNAINTTVEIMVDSLNTIKVYEDRVKKLDNSEDLEDKERFY